MSLSLCLMVRNEAASLPTCLQSVADLVDETIVVDTGSTDGTRELADKLGARVFEFPWCDDFAAARNECIRHRQAWVGWEESRKDAETMEVTGTAQGGKSVPNQILIALFPKLRLYGFEDKNIVRVTGPFTVESLSPHRALPTAEAPVTNAPGSANGSPGNFLAMILDNLRKSGVKGTDSLPAGGKVYPSVMGTSHIDLSREGGDDGGDLVVQGETGPQAGHYDRGHQAQQDAL